MLVDFAGFFAERLFCSKTGCRGLMYYCHFTIYIMGKVEFAGFSSEASLFCYVDSGKIV